VNAEYSMIAEQKQSLRERARGLLAAMPPVRSRLAGAAILGHLALWLEWHRARTVCLFSPLADEPDILSPWPEGKTVLMPRVAEKDLRLHAVAGPGELAPGKFGIMQPLPSTPSAPERADFILVPGLAFDASGGRLGRGGGFYDRLLSRFEGVRVGVCFNETLFEEIPREGHDAVMDFVATPDGVISCGT
jgi:5-formyltetrahydrofolate cyclo-ligase